MHAILISHHHNIIWGTRIYVIAKLVIFIWKEFNRHRQMRGWGLSSYPIRIVDWAITKGCCTWVIGMKMVIS
jgi:hypothetical protein